MKTLQLKNYLLVEPENPVYLTVSESGLFYADPETKKSELIEGNFKLLCMGDEFEKDQQAAKDEGCILGQLFSKIGFDAFVKEVEEAGYYWRKNELTDSISAPDIQEWNELQSVTFNPSKTKIYQVIS